MKKTIHFSRTVPAWQIERARKLHRACLSLQSAIQRGETKSKALRRVARNFTGRKFKSNPARHMALSAGTLRRLFRVWQRGGEVPSALIIQWRSRRTTIPAPLLVRFADFCSRTRQPNLRAAWQKFCAHGGSFGRGRRARKSLRISYGQVRYHFPVAGFYLMQSKLKAIATAQTEMGALRLAIAADIRRRLPDRPARKPAILQPEYQI
jgi:hypothetical protein